MTKAVESRADASSLRTAPRRVAWQRTCAAAALLGFMASGGSFAFAQHFDTKQYRDQIRPLLARHCLECHSGEKPKGDFRLDRLSADFADRATNERWQAVLARVKTGEMPPKEKPR